MVLAQEIGNKGGSILRFYQMEMCMWGGFWGEGR